MSAHRAAPNSVLKQDEVVVGVVAEKSRPMKATKAFTLRARTVIPSGNAKEVIQALRPLAESGDAKAALGIYLKLGACRNAMGSVPSEAEVEAYKKAGAAEAILAGAEQRIAECEGTKQLLSEQGRWLEQAADGGLLEAQLLYGVDTEAVLGGRSEMLRDPARVQRYKDKAVGYLQNLASQGNIDAMISLAGAYNNGILVKQDSIRAYAYYKAAQLAMPNLVPEALLAAYRSKISSGDMARGDKVAQEIYRSCCEAP